jgi:acyl transferase domain-containing protein/SAM-dependent methyltransferase/acyl carrier protein
VSDFLDRIRNLPPKRLALLALELHDQVEALQQREHEPIAVVGLACRFPGANSAEQFWQLLQQGRDAIGGIPADRWDIDSYFDPDPDAPARMAVRAAGFLDDIASFDPQFFGISPREALIMDPQQRLLLEVAWEALEHAGLSADRLAGSSTGVFVGICNNDHFYRLLQRGPDNIDAYLASGNAPSVAAGRISYCLGLRGPALAIDTACSSSLAALHVACRSLRNRETEVALCGGVNVICSPEITIALSKAHMLAPDGRCKTFDARADGFARGEGCGVVVLKRFADAVANNDRVLGIIRGTAANQDGRSGGLTVPNGPAQQAVVRAALADGQVRPEEIDYVEAHGTGTALGDPIEARALGGVFGSVRTPDDPLLIGSVKTNIGHLEAAAGIAGVIKVILSLEHEHIPPHLHFREPSPHIAWSDYPIRVVPDGRPWLRGKRPRLAGVSSFGFSGTNAHVILQEAPRQKGRSGTAQRRAYCLPLSARTDAALHRLTGDYAAMIGRHQTPALADIERTAGAGRSHFETRLAVVADTPRAAQDAWSAFAAGEAHPAIRFGTSSPGQAPEVVFLFSGQGTQYARMGRSLYETSPVFRDVIDRCDHLLGTDRKGHSLKLVLWEVGTGEARIHDTAWTQPALFAVEYGLTELWRSWGIEPAAVIGHSVGEYVAACVAGVFSLEDGLRLIAERGRLMAALPAGGGMATIFASTDAVNAAIASYSDRLSIAAINSPENVVISGESRAVDAVVTDFAARNVRVHKLLISLGAHSPCVDPALDAMETLACSVTMRPPRIPIAWNLTGRLALPAGSVPDAIYWRRHMREPVHFLDGLRSLDQEGYRAFLEVGPHPSLLAIAQQSLPQDGIYLSSLRRDHDDWTELLGSVAKLYVHGATIDWKGLSGPYGGQTVSLPTYPFERRSYWVDVSNTPDFGRARLTAPAKNPLVGARLPVAVPVFETVLTPETPWYLTEHRACDEVLVAGSVLLEMAQACATEAFGPERRVMESFIIREPLVVRGSGRTVQIHFAESEEDAMAFSIHSRAADGAENWLLHAAGRLVDAARHTSGAESSLEALASLKERLGTANGCDDFFHRLNGLGIEIGTRFRSLRDVRRRDGEALARLECPLECGSDQVSWAHPSLIDGAMMTCGLALPSSAHDHLYLLAEIERVELATPLPPALWCHAQVRKADQESPPGCEVDVVMRDSEGREVGTFRGVKLRRTSQAALAAAAVGSGTTAADDLAYEIKWETVPLSTSAASLLKPADEFVPEIRHRFARLAQRHGLSVYDTLLPELDQLSADFIVKALQEIGFDDSPGRPFDPSTEAVRLGIIERHGKLFGRMLEILIEEKQLRKIGDGSVEILKRLAPVDPSSRRNLLLSRFENCDAELRILGRCGGELGRVLVGKQDPLELLFSGSSEAELRKLYVEAPFARTYNGTLVEALQAAIADLPLEARLRVLEIGAGTGGTTTRLLPVLPKDRVEYTFTDVSPLFLERAATSFAQYHFVRRAVLDIEQDPLAQGFKAGQYDVVVAANVLHATADLPQTIEHIRSLLAPKGLLFLLEGVGRERWVDLTFGLTEGWWRFSDSLRTDYPLISRDAWRDLLQSQGFVDVAAIPDGGPDLRAAAQQALVLARAPGARRHWTIVGEVAGAGRDLAEQLRTGGDKVTLRDVADEAAAIDGNLVYLGASMLAERAITDASACSDCSALACERPMKWLAKMSQETGSGRAWLVTRGAQAAHGSMAPGARWQAPLWGVGRVFALEQPERWGGLVDLPPESEAGAVEILLREFSAIDGEDQTAWRDGKRLAARLTRSAIAAKRPVRLRSDGTYLVTGGFGGLGLLVARWMAEAGAKTIALMGRRPQPDCDGVRALETLGVRVISLAGDVSDTASMREVLARLAAEAPPLRGIVHAAADFSTSLIGQSTREDVQRALLPKVDGTVVLEELTSGQDLDFIVLFSSTTALLGAAGFAAYAAANAFLDGAADTSDKRGGRVVSINWGTWQAMRLASAESQTSFRLSGLNPIPNDKALDALARVLAGRERRAVIADIDWSVLKPLHESRRSRPFLSLLGTESRLAKVVPQRKPASDPDLLDRLSRVPAEMRQDAMFEFVTKQVAAVLGLDASEPVPPDVGFFDMGMDSLMSVELKRRLEQGVGRRLPSTLTFNYPNVSVLAAFLVDALGIATAATEAEAGSSVTPLGSTGDALNELSEQELEERLLARLEETR